MCCCNHTIQLKCTSSYPVINSFLSTYSQLHQRRLCMCFFSQATIIHQVRINIIIIRSYLPSQLWMFDDLPSCCPQLHKSDECYDQHHQIFVPHEHYRSKACHPGTMENPSCDDIFHIPITAMVPYHHLCFASL